MSIPSLTSSLRLEGNVSGKLKGYRSRPGKQVNLTEAEVRGLCIKSRDIFIN